MNSDNQIFKFSRTVIIVIFVLVAGMVYFIYNFFKTKTESEQPPIPVIPNNGVNIPTDYKTTASNIASQVFSAIDDWFVWSSDKEAVFKILYNLTDDQLVYVYIVYNNMYFSKHKESMTQSIDNEFPFTNSIKSSLVKRLQSLGCP